MPTRRPQAATKDRTQLEFEEAGLGSWGGRRAFPLPDLLLLRGNGEYAQDLAQLCRASRIGARIDTGSLPLSAELRRRAQTTERAVRWALTGGEDYELLIAVPPAGAAAFERHCARFGERVSQVGVVTSGAQVKFVSPEGTTIAPPRGYDHFAGVRSPTD